MALLIASAVQNYESSSSMGNRPLRVVVADEEGKREDVSHKSVAPPIFSLPQATFNILMLQICRCGCWMNSLEAGIYTQVGLGLSSAPPFR